MINRVVLVGRLTRDPELRYTPNGVAVTNFNIAVNRPFKNQNGESEADFINGVVWRKPAENLANYMKKGSMIGVDGRLQTRSYEGQDGKTVYVTEVVAENIQYLDSRNSRSGTNQDNFNQGNANPSSSQTSGYSGGQTSNQSNYQQGYQQSDPFANNGGPIDINDDNLPF